MDSPSIGIDLGTTHSCVAVFRDGDVEIIPNEHNELTTPSWVYIDGSEVIVGKRAVMMASKKPKNTIYDIKRMIGRNFEEMNKQDLEAWPFDVVAQDSKPLVKIDQKTYHPEQISAMVLTKMKEIAEQYLETEVRDVVITVPAQFNNSQRQATIDAAKIADLNVLQLLVEPTAAALTYGFQHASEQERNVLVYDLGGGTFDVSIVHIKGEEFTVKATGGDTHLGGQDFDDSMVTHLAEEYKKTHGVDLKKDRRVALRLKIRCEDAKRVLSTHLSAEIEIMNLVGDDDYSSNISRTTFEELIEERVVGTLKTVEEVLKMASLEKSQIDDIVLVGGSSRIPRIQGALRHFFNDKPLKKSVNPDEAVAYGAAVRAATLKGDEIVTKVKVCDVTPFSLGINVAFFFIFERISVLIPKNSAIPISVTEEYSTNVDNQEKVIASVYEGESPVVEHNRKLGTLEFNNIPKGPAGSVKFDATFHLDINGVLKFTAVEKSTGKKESIDISYKAGRLTDNEKKAMMEEAERLKAEDRDRRIKLQAKMDLEFYCGEMILKAKRGEITGKKAKNVTKSCEDTLKWIDVTPACSKEDFEEKLKDLESRFGKIEL